MRLATRVRSALRVDWCLDGREAHVISDVENMSARGALIRTDSPPAAGTRLQLSLLTDRGMVPALGRVVRVDSHGMAVRFEPSESDADSDEADLG